MNMLFFILCLVPQSVDTLWTVDFSSTSGDWIAGPFWEYTEESIFLDLMCDGMGNSIEDSLISPDFVVPLSADSLVLVFDHYWWGHGGSSGWPTDWARSTSTLNMYSSSPPHAIELWEIVDSCGGKINLNSDSSNGKLLDTRAWYSLIDSGSVYISLSDVWAGDTLSFTFKGLVESYWWGGIAAEANIEWDIYLFSILNYPSVRLEQSTWGMIKTSF